MKIPLDDITFLKKHGWVELPVLNAWRWKQPKTGARFQFQDALDTARGLENDKRTRPKKNVTVN